MKVIINVCYGGFGLSSVVYEELIEMGWEVTTFNKAGGYVNPNAKIVKQNKGSMGFTPYSFVYNPTSEVNERTDKDVIAVVEKLGSKKASGQYAKLKIVEIPDGIKYEIEEYDGMEHIAEEHRTWG